MGWGKTVIISKDRRVIADLGERSRGDTERPREGKIENVTKKHVRTIERTQYAEKNPFNNGQAKSGALPNPGFRPQKWPYVNRNPSTEATTSNPRWTHNPPVNKGVQAGLITHFAVRPVNTHPEQTIEDQIDQIINSLSFQHYPQIQTPYQDRYQTNFKTSTQPHYSSYYPHHTAVGIKTTSHGVPATFKPRLTTPVYSQDKLVTWIPQVDY